MKIIAAFPKHIRERVFTPATWQKLESLGQFLWLTDYDKPNTETFAALCKKNGGADIILTGWGGPKITPEVLDANPTLKLIAHSAGSVAHVDIAAWKRNIAVTNVMPVMGHGVAEFSLLFILDGLRRFSGHVRPELWGTMPFFASPQYGTMLRKKRVGLVGLGIIGRQTLDLLKPFNCEIVVYDPFLPAEAITPLGAKKVELDELMATSQAVSLHAPGTLATQNTINEKNLRLLKPGSVLVNTARGILIDHDALAKVAAEGKIGAYLDVTYPEPLPADHPLRKLPNVVITPHVAGPTVDGQWELGECAVAELERLTLGQPLHWIVTENQYMNQSRTT